MQIDLLNLDIRAIDPLYGLSAGKRRTVSQKKFPDGTDLGIIYLEGRALKSLVVRGGWDILQEGLDKIHQHGYKFPQVRHHEMFINDIQKEESFSEVRYSRHRFQQEAGEFVERYAFGRLETEILTVDAYLERKQNMPGGIPTVSREVYRRQAELSRKFEKALKEDPRIISLPGNSRRFFSEVRLDNKLSNCMMSSRDYTHFLQGYTSPTSSLGICDFVLKYGHRLYVIELKTTTGRQKSFLKKKARQQLANSAMFFQQNFGINPVLVEVLLIGPSERERLAFRHYSFSNGRLGLLNPGYFPL